MGHGDFLDRKAGGHHVVRHGEGVVVPEDDLVLARRDLVVGGLDGDPEVLEVVDRRPSVLLGDVQGREVEVAAAVEHDRLGRAVLEVEELHLRADVEPVPVVGRGAQRAFEHVARVAFEGSAVRAGDVAEHAGDVLLCPPGDHLEGTRVGSGDHVGFLDPGVPVDRGAIERHALLEGALEFRRVDRHRLQESLDIGEPQPDEPDLPLCNGLEDVLGLSVTTHRPKTVAPGPRQRPLGARRRNMLFTFG